MAFMKPTLVAALLAVFFLSVVLLLGIFLPQKTPRGFLNQSRAVESIRKVNLAEHN